MDTPAKAFYELIEIICSWFPKKTKSANLSRDFWMPDHSCRVCYECDSQFTIFNRRHHCRLCGRIFCGKCTANSIPAPSDEPKTGWEEWERIRVCNYCCKQREQEIAANNNGIQVSSPILSPSPSATSLVSTKTSGTANTSSTTGSMPYSSETYHHVSHGSDLSPVKLESSTDKQDIVVYERNTNPIRDPSPNSFGFCMNRSDDDYDEYNVYRSDSEIRHFPQSGDYYVSVDFDVVDHAYAPNNVIPDEVNIKIQDLTNSTVIETLDSQELGRVNMLDQQAEGHNNSDECDTTPLYGLEGKDIEPVDFENNGLLWLLPGPEDEDDDREVVLFDDDDDDATGEWRYLRSTSSFGSGEFRSKDRSSEEHKKAMKSVVDGHFRALVAQLLQVENLHVGEEDDTESWLEIITSLSWEAATLLKPDTSKGGGMDPGGYVKVKCLACGRRSESMVVKGVVCKKNVAHRRMTSKIEKPRFLILGGALEYQRVSNSLSSIDTLLQQEMDHLKMAVAKIDAQHPNVLLVEKTVSRFAQDYLHAKDIALVLNIKKPLLERIARCTGAQIVPSIDHLSSRKLGYCDTFHVEKFLEEHGSAGQAGKKLVKTLMFFEDCPKPLGYTILLKGANGDELKKVKHVVQYGVFAAYHLAMETCFLADEGASLPELPLKSPITVALPDKPSSIDGSISTIPGFTIPATGEALRSQSSTDLQKPSKIFAKELTSPIQSSSLNKWGMNVSPFSFKSPLSQFTGPVPSFISSSASISSPSPNGQFVSSSLYDELSPCSVYEEKYKIDFDEPLETKASVANNSQDIVANDPRLLEAAGQGAAAIDNPFGNKNALAVSKLGTSDLATLQQDGYNYHEELGSSKEDFPQGTPDHQSILVFLSSRCIWKGTVCERAHLFRIKYYGSSDKPLGRFLRDHLFDQSFRCRSCEMPSEAHVHSYTHRQGTLTISVKKLPELLLPGEREGKIWMWHRCLRCPRIDGFPPATRRVVMSDAAWGLSFGKFLELSFSNHAAASMVASCGHSLHRDCLRFYGFGRMVACFHYASIDVHSIYLPPSKLDFKYNNQEWIEKEVNKVNETCVRVYDGEVTSVIAFALISADYYVQLSDDRETPKDCAESSVSLPIYDAVDLDTNHLFDKTPFKVPSESVRALLYSKSLHANVSFTDVGPLGKVNYTVTCYFAKRFDALRRICCPSELDFTRSLARCKKWESQGGKRNVFFAKTLDDRFIIKQVTKAELEFFMQFAPEYFKYVSESIVEETPSCLAKILGIYQVTSKLHKGGMESRMDVLVMENLLFGRNVTRLYDLKGSSQSRYNPDASGSNKVLLDQNLIEAMATSPIFVGNKAKRLLERAIWNDTSFLESIDVMDYSLFVGVDEEKHELVVGTIDFLKQYTWDKHLETWVKSLGILGGSKNSSPTVISPKQYKKRFRKAMSEYFLMVPDQ